MERKVNYVFIGFCFLISLISVVIFIFWFYDLSIKNYMVYRVYSSSGIPSIRSDTTVKYKGINVGKIKDIRLDKNEGIEIKLIIDKDIKIKKGSFVQLDSTGLMGINFLSIIQNDESSDFIENNKDAVLIFIDSKFSNIISRIEPITDQIDLLLKNTNDSISGIKTNIDKINIDHINELIYSINVSSQSLNKLINLTVKTIEENNKSLNNALKNIENITKDLDNKISNNEYEKLIYPMFSAVEEMISKVDRLMQKSQNILHEFEENPYNTIFGYKNNDYNK